MEYEEQAHPDTLQFNKGLSSFYPDIGDIQGSGMDDRQK